MFPALEGKRVHERLPQIAVDSHFFFLAHIVLQSLQRRHHSAKCIPLPSIQVFLLIFVQQKEKVNVIAMRQIQMHVPVATTFAFSATRVGDASFADSAQALHKRHLFRDS